MKKKGQTGDRCSLQEVDVKVNYCIYQTLVIFLQVRMRLFMINSVAARFMQWKFIFNQCTLKKKVVFRSNRLTLTSKSSMDAGDIT